MIYFLRNRDGSAIKIGTTIRLSARLKQLASEHGDLELLAVLDGGRFEEQALHQRFATLRTVGEWFEPGDDLVGFIVAEGRPWVREKDDAEPAMESVKLPADVMDSARIVAAYTGGSIAEMLGDMLRPILAKREREEAAKRAKERGDK